MYLGVDQECQEEVATGERSVLPGEDDSTMTSLTIIRNYWGEQVILNSMSKGSKINLRVAHTLFSLGTVLFTIVSIWIDPTSEPKSTWSSGWGSNWRCRWKGNRSQKTTSRSNSTSTTRPHAIPQKESSTWVSLSLFWHFENYHEKKVWF